MLRQASIVGHLLFILLSTTAYAQEKETIQWLTWEQVPNFITQGKYQGQGLGDSFTKALQDKLPQYKHVNLVANAHRYFKLIRQENVCVAWAWIVPGSKEYRVHSRPVSLAHRSGIQILKSNQDLFGKAGSELSLAKLLKNPNLKLGVLNEMVYTQKVMKLLEQYKSKANVYVSSAGAVEFDLQMLDYERVDYLFSFPSQAIYNAEVKGIKNNYQFYNIKEIDMYTSMHSHCSKTAFGKKVMGHINKILTNEMLMEHLAVVERWNGKNKHYRDIFLDYVINQNPNDQVTNPGQ